MPNPLEAAIVGNVIFIALALLGGALYKKKAALAFLVAACLLSPAVLKVSYPTAILAGVAMISGGFFPACSLFPGEAYIPADLDGLGAR